MFDWSKDAHEYQKRGAAHLYGRSSAALWLSPGYGKTAITLHTFKAMMDAGMAQHMLIVAPLRVVQTVWAQEIENWSSLHGLRAARLHGPKKDKWLKRRDVNVWLLNYEGIPWLADLAKRGKLPFQFDVVVFDEIRRMKNAQGFRFKAMRPMAAMAKYRWGLTGTPASNGLMDLFGQFLILDNGATLGQRITRFRHDYFEQGYDGFTWVPRPGAQDAIEAKIAPLVFRADGILDLPDFVHDARTVALDAKARKTYTTLKNDLIAELGDTKITAANAAVLMGKLKQMANGRVYDENHVVHEIHSAKQDALRELVEELGAEQLLIAYEYNHDLAQIREVLGEDLPYLGSGVNEKTAMDHVDRWNRREIQIMAAHPASAGHGINLQKGGAHHILWWGPTFDLDHYIQFNDRLRRQGNTADAVVVHTFVTERSVDETAIKAREGKQTVQDALLSALTAEFGDSITIDKRITEKDDSMTQLQFKSDAALSAQAAPAANPFAAAQPQQAAPAANPFAASQPQAAANPFAAAQPQAATQVQAIQQDVAAAPPPTPQTINNPFLAQAQPVQDAEIVSEQPAPNITATPEDRRPPVADTGWQEPATKPAIAVPATAPGGMVPLYTFIPSDKLDKVLSAIARAVK